jgi:hypothetical protein
MKIRIIVFSLVTVLGLLGSDLHAVSAMELKKPAGGSAPLRQSFVWYDGNIERKVWLSPDLTAEFVPDRSAAGPFKKAYPDAEELESRQAGVRLWRLPGGVDSKEAAKRMKILHPGGRYSPVLHDSPIDSGRKRALPGGVIVYLNPAWDQTAVKSWADSHRLEIVQKLEIGPNVFVLKTGPGLEALETANALYRSGEVRGASPVWWQEAVTR